MHAGMPILFSIILLVILKKKGALPFWIVGTAVGLGFLLLSNWVPLLIFRYNKSLDAAGVKTIFCSFSALMMVLSVYLLSRTSFSQKGTVVLSSIIGIFTLFLGLWIS